MCQLSWHCSKTPALGGHFDPRVAGGFIWVHSNIFVLFSLSVPAWCCHVSRSSLILLRRHRGSLSVPGHLIATHLAARLTELIICSYQRKISSNSICLSTYFQDWLQNRNTKLIWFFWILTHKLSVLWTASYNITPPLPPPHSGETSGMSLLVLYSVVWKPKP